jgi:hypothetical protein
MAIEVMTQSQGSRRPTMLEKERRSANFRTAWRGRDGWRPMESAVVRAMPVAASANAAMATIQLMMVPDWPNLYCSWGTVMSRS